MKLLPPAVLYKKEFTQNVIQPINKMYFDKDKDRNIRYFTKYNPHVFERVLQRRLNKETFAEIFQILMKDKYDYLMEIFKRDKDKMNSKSSICIFVRRKGITICFIVFDDERDGYFSLMPLTVLGEYEYRKCDYIIEL